MDRKGDQAKIIKSINEKLAKEMKTPENMKQLAELMGKAQQENLDKVNINLNTDKTAVSIDGTGLKKKEHEAIKKLLKPDKESLEIKDDTTIKMELNGGVSVDTKSVESKINKEVEIAKKKLASVISKAKTEMTSYSMRSNAHPEKSLISNIKLTTEQSKAIENALKSISRFSGSADFSKYEDKITSQVDNYQRLIQGFGESKFSVDKMNINSSSTTEELKKYAEEVFKQEQILSKIYTIRESLQHLSNDKGNSINIKDSILDSFKFTNDKSTYKTIGSRLTGELENRLKSLEYAVSSKKDGGSATQFSLEKITDADSSSVLNLISQRMGKDSYNEKQATSAKKIKQNIYDIGTAMKSFLKNSETVSEGNSKLSLSEKNLIKIDQDRISNLVKLNQVLSENKDIVNKNGKNDSKTLGTLDSTMRLLTNSKLNENGLSGTTQSWFDDQIAKANVETSDSSLNKNSLISLKKIFGGDISELSKYVALTQEQKNKINEVIAATNKETDSVKKNTIAEKENITAISQSETASEKNTNDLKAIREAYLISGNSQGDLDSQKEGIKVLEQRNITLERLNQLTKEYNSYPPILKHLSNATSLLSNYDTSQNVAQDTSSVTSTQKITEANKEASEIIEQKANSEAKDAKETANKAKADEESLQAVQEKIKTEQESIKITEQKAKTDAETAKSAKEKAKAEQDIKVQQELEAKTAEELRIKEEQEAKITEEAAKKRKEEIQAKRAATIEAKKNAEAIEQERLKEEAYNNTVAKSLSLAKNSSFESLMNGSDITGRNDYKSNIDYMLTRSALDQKSAKEDSVGTSLAVIETDKQNLFNQYAYEAYVKQLQVTMGVEQQSADTTQSTVNKKIKALTEEDNALLEHEKKEEKYQSAISSPNYLGTLESGLSEASQKQALLNYTKSNQIGGEVLQDSVRFTSNKGLLTLKADAVNADNTITKLVYTLDKYTNTVSYAYTDTNKLASALNKVGRIKVSESEEENNASLLNFANTRYQSVNDNSAVYSKLSNGNQQLAISARDAEGAMKKFFLTLNVGNGDISELSKTIPKARSQFDYLKSSLSSHTTALVSYLATFASFYQAIDVIRQGIDVVTNFDKAMTTISLTMDTTKTQLNDLTKSSIEMAKQMGTTADQVTNVAQIYANMNTSTQEIMETAKPTVMLATASGLDTSTVSDDIQAVMNEFEMGSDQAMHIADVYESISANIAMDFGKGIGVIAEAVQTSGALANEAGKKFMPVRMETCDLEYI